MEWTMKTVYLGCAALGGSVLVLQTLLLMLGGGDVDADADADADGHGADGGHGGAHDLLSLRAITSFLTFFGLAGWGGTEAGWSAPLTMGVAALSGVVMLFVVAAMTTLHRRVYSQGNVEPANAVGSTARVYLRIPEKGAGEGKITVSLQGRSLEYAATSSGPALPTGSEVRVLRVSSPNTFEVEPLDQRSPS